MIRSMKRRSSVFALLSGVAAWAILSFAPQAALSQDVIGSVQDVYNGTLTPAVQANTFRHIDRLFPTRMVPHGASIYPLPKSSRPLKNISFISGGRRHDLFDYLSLNRVSGLLVIKDGTIALENYELGNNDQSRWVSWSIAKSISSTLVGAAIQDGYITSLDDKVTKYLPKLAGGAYADVSIRNLLQMASGVRWNETYTDPKSDRRRMLDLQIAQKPGAILQFMAALPRTGAPGTVWNYSTGETHIAGALVSAAVKRPLAQYLSQKIWTKFGMESDATWWLESPGGLEVGGSGFSATLRDYGRFGLFVLNGGVAGKEHIVPANWFSEAGSPKRVGGQFVNYGYMWWITDSSAFEAVGIFGQMLYINPKQHVVIAVWSARPKPTGSTVISDDDFFAAVVTALQP